MTPAQLTTLKAAIVADSTMNAFANTSGGNFALAAYLNSVPGTPTQLWRPDISPAEVTRVIGMSEFVLLTAVKQNGLLLLTQGTVDATSAVVRASFASIFAAGVTLTALNALAIRPGTRLEVIFSSVSGSANVSTVYGQTVTWQDVQQARDS